MNATRIALGVEYGGEGFHGFQRQAHARSVQAALEAALARVADRPVTVVCAGRTDRGVHATAQVVHFDAEVDRGERAWTLGVNRYLPADIAVVWAQQVSPHFHARYSARRRHYRYLISNRHGRPGLWSGRVTWHPRPLDPVAMGEAALDLVGRHDFSAFRAAECQARHPIRTVFRIAIAERGSIVSVDLIANAFLHHMVRNIIGVLLPIGRGDAPVTWAGEVLRGRDRARAGVTAPPDGLYFTGVDYPAGHQLPRPPAAPRLID